MNQLSSARASRLALFCILLAASGLIACHATSTVEAQRTAGPPPGEKPHVVRSEKLRVIMRQMELLMQDRVRSDLELDKERSRRSEELAASAGELAAAASAISRASTYATLDAAARQRFDAFAVELQRDAVELQRLAREGEVFASAAQFERMNHTCAGCHSLYRAR